MTDPLSRLASAREAYGRRDWPTAFELLRPLRDEGLLGEPDDQAMLADSAWWLGRVDESNAAFELAYKGYLGSGRAEDAALMAMSIAVSCYLRGEDATASGWMSRCTRLLPADGDGVMHGYVRYVLEVESQFGAPAGGSVIEAARWVRECGRRHGDANLVALGLLGEGRALLHGGEIGAGMTLLDEAMVAVLDDELIPDWAGNIYCTVMIACHELADHARAAHWVDATERWLDTLPAAVLFRGICRVHRSQVHQLRGAWERAEQEARRVVTDLADISFENVAEGWYQVGEIRRLRGDLVAAETAYREAHRLGRDPQPGLALLRLVQDRAATAAASLEAALHARADQPLARAPLLSARVEVLLATGAIAEARLAADELAAIAERYRSSGLLASASQATGCVLLAEGASVEALRSLLDALGRWQALDAPYEVAVVRRRLARAYDALGDTDAAGRERDAAAAVLAELGAPLEDAAAGGPGRGLVAGGLSEREVEVLRLVARGWTNQAVADELGISGKTVARHLSNIFTKLDLETRTEAAAYAFANGLADPAGG